MVIFAVRIPTEVLMVIFAVFEQVIIKISHQQNPLGRNRIPKFFFFFFFFLQYIKMAKPTEYKLRKTAKRKSIVGYQK